MTTYVAVRARRRWRAPWAALFWAAGVAGVGWWLAVQPETTTGQAIGGCLAAGVLLGTALAQPRRSPRRAPGPRKVAG